MFLRACNLAASDVSLPPRLNRNISAQLEVLKIHLLNGSMGAARDGRTSYPSTPCADLQNKTIALGKRLLSFGPHCQDAKETQSEGGCPVE